MKGQLSQLAFMFSRSERSKVRVSFYQGARPQCVSPPPPQDPPALLAALLAADMATDVVDNPLHSVYNRQVRSVLPVNI